MLRDALGALRDWQDNGVEIPAVGVNFDPDSLRDPALPDLVAWELDRHGLGPERLCIEIMETVVSMTPDDRTARNIRRLAAHGCRIDLDDFGTGHASISSLKRFEVNRLKIDRSFIRGIDHDRDQQRMVAAILTMAAQLGPRHGGGSVSRPRCAGPGWPVWAAGTCRGSRSRGRCRGRRPCPGSITPCPPQLPSLAPSMALTARLPDPGRQSAALGQRVMAAPTGFSLTFRPSLC